MPSDHDLAWALADHIAPGLVDHDKTAIYVDLGCGNGREAIGHMLNVTVRDQLRLREALICQIGVWLDGYAGTADERRSESCYANYNGEKAQTSRRHSANTTPPNRPWRRCERRHRRPFRLAQRIWGAKNLH
jgi:hypothetical protein